MRALLALIAKELRVLSRDRHGLAVLFIMPAVFILIMSLALRDAMDPGKSAAITYAWADEDGGYFALALSDVLAAHGAMRRAEPGAAAPFAVHIAKGFDERIKAAGTDGVKPPLVELQLSPSAPIQARLLFVAQVRAALASVQAEYLMEDQMGVPHADAERLRAQTDASSLPITETYIGAGAASVGAPNAVQQSVPAWLVFAMFFVVLPLGTSVLAEREQGSLQRLALLNVSPARLLAAKFPAYYLLNMVQLAVMLAVGAWIVPRFGGDALALNGSPLGLWLVASGLSFAAIGFGLLIAVLARSAVQATTFGGVANLVLGAIGGVMVPKLVMPAAMQSLAALSPMSWALEGCWDILLRGGGLMEVLPESAALAGFGLLSYLIATFLFPKTDS
jgi:ABC-2 type transport system permease protein